MCLYLASYNALPLIVDLKKNTSHPELAMTMLLHNVLQGPHCLLEMKSLSFSEGSFYACRHIY